MNEYVILLKNNLDRSETTKIIFSYESPSDRSFKLNRDKPEQDVVSLESRDFPNKLNTALHALDLFRNQFVRQQLEETSMLHITIEGDLMYAFFIFKELLRRQINFKVKINSSIDDYQDYLAGKFRQFVSKVADMDFSRISEGSTINYPQTFTSCFDSDCIHPTRDFLENQVKTLSISVVIPTRNIPNSWIYKLLTQVSAQISSDDEIIVIDDNDIQGDFTSIENIHPNTRIIRGKRVGISSARNLGVAASTKDLIQFIDSDDEITPGFIESQRNFHMKFKNVSASGAWLQAFGSHTRIYPQWDGFSPLGVYQCLPPAGVLMWKRKALVEVGEFLDEFAKGFEDFDVVARAISRDHIIVIFEDISYLYRRGHKSLTHSLGKSDQTELFRLVWKNARNLCDSNFLNFIELGLKYGEKLHFDSTNYIFLGKKKKRYLSQIARRARNNNMSRNLWALLPQSLRGRIFKFAMKQ